MSGICINCILDRYMYFDRFIHFDRLIYFDYYVVFNGPVQIPYLAKFKGSLLKVYLWNSTEDK